MAETAWKAIDFNPWNANVMDYAYREGLQTKDGRTVQIRREFMGTFLVVIGEKRHSGLTNIAATALLNQHETGICQKSY